MTYAHAGVGSSSHLCGLLFMRAMEAQMTTVPYKGTGPAMTDLLGGQVNLLCDHVSTAVPQVKAGKIKPYVVTTKERVPSLPDVPTADEAGLKGFELGVWYGLYAPKGTEKPVIDKLVAVVQRSLQDPQVIQRFASNLGTAPVATVANARGAAGASSGRDRPLAAGHLKRRASHAAVDQEEIDPPQAD